MLGAASIHPDFREVIPLMPEPIITHEGTTNNDGERNAAKRFMAKLRQDPPHLTCIIPEDSLRSHAPHLETRHDDGCHAILGVKEGDQASLCQPVQMAEHAGRVTSDARHDRAAGVIHRFRVVTDVPLTTARTDVRVHFMESWEIGPDQVQHFRWVTDVRVSQRHVAQRMRGGRARWNIEHETLHTLKNQGDTFEHHYGHGAQNLSGVLPRLLLLAFLVDQTQQRCGALFRAVWTKLGRKRLVWERLRALCYAYRLESRHALWEALWYGFEKPRPILIPDTS
jgi:hypothetical protein